VDRLLARLSSAPPRVFAGTVLVDGQWDNPNYWLRYALLRAGLGLPGSEVGLLGRYHSVPVRQTFETLGIRRTVSME